MSPCPLKSLCESHRDKKLSHFLSIEQKQQVMAKSTVGPDGALSAHPAETSCRK